MFGTVYENSLVDSHKIMLSPRAMGTVTNIVEKGSYSVDVCTLSFITLPRRDLTLSDEGYCVRNRIQWQNNETYYDAVMARSCTSASS